MQHCAAIETFRQPEVSAVASDGFVILNAAFKPVFVNRAAADILSYGHKPNSTARESFLTSRIHSLFTPAESASMSTVVTTVQSGRRIYECRAYRLSAVVKTNSQVSMAILLERRPKASATLYEISSKFSLTTRERQVLHHLSHGLTTKEIAVGMEISPNTVKAFVRMIMVKMGVSTRSGIVGKALGTGA